MEVWKALPYVGYSMFDFDARIPPGEDRAGRVLLGVYHHSTVGSPSTKGRLGFVPDVFDPAFKTTKKTISGATSTMPKKRRKALERKALERFSLRVY